MDLLSSNGGCPAQCVIRQNGVSAIDSELPRSRRRHIQVDRAARLPIIERIGSQTKRRTPWRDVPNRSRKPTRAAPSRKYDPERTKRDILSVATKEFAKHGFNGARIDAIAARTSTTKRMIYYYFGGKEQLYIAVLEQEYAKIRDDEARRCSWSASTPRRRSGG